ncbi:MAG: non-ribosomal peptide synthetase, partial [Verrucomicrobiales bacterium]
MNPSAKPTEPANTLPHPADDVLAFPASVAQQMFWYLELLEGNVTAFNVALRFKLDGPLDADILRRALNTIIDRHEALRTRFAEHDGELLQIISPELTLDLPLIDISHLPADRVEEETDRLGSIEAHRPFNLATGPMIRAELIKISADHHLLHVSLHHAIFDGMSMTVLTRELATIYQDYFDGNPCSLEPLALQYGDYSVWQREFLDSPEMQTHLDYWKKQLEGMTEPDLPTDFPRPPVKTWKGDIISTLLPAALMEKLHRVATRHGATLFHLQLSAFMIMLHRYCGTRDITLGTPVTGRTRGELEPLIGVFINSLILRGDLSGNPDFGTFLTRVRDTVFDALEHQELPFEYLVRELQPGRDPSRNPLFQINFNHHRSFSKPGKFGGVELNPIPSRSPGTIFDLHFFMVERAEGWRASCDYSTDLFSRESAERMLGHFKHLLEQIAENPDRPIDNLDILTKPERVNLLDNWSGESRPYPRDATIGSLFLETAAAHPERTALESAERSFSYRQLRNEAVGIAGKLIKAGVKPGDMVALVTCPGPEMIAGFLAIFLAGGCSVPLDPAYPSSRFNLLLTDSGARHALVASEHRNAFPATWPGTTTLLGYFGSASSDAAAPDLPTRADSPSHLLFTSGSTGRPKGVLLPHRGTVRLVKNNHFIPITEDDVFLQAAPASFDATLLEIWGPLLNGGRLVLLPDGPGLEEIATAVRERGVTTLWLTAGLFQLMIDEHADSLKSLRHLLAGGDVLSTTHVRKALNTLPVTKIINGYGPTENTTFTTCHPISPDDTEKPSIPIGKPIANTSVFILDEDLRPVPVGIPGELCTGGDGLAIGYLNDDQLTAERFINHPDFGRIYRTGDLCRRMPDGTIEFLGRRDHQVKVRGFRIELGEIESQLARHPDVANCKAAVRGEGAETKRLLAWIVPAAGKSPDPAVLSAYLADALPPFMQPEAIGVVDSFPLNANGKINTRKLPEPRDQLTPSAEIHFEEPAGPTEQQLAAIWRELLTVQRIGRHDDFFALGGHSLMALRLFSRISREFGKSLPLATLLHHPTIASLADLIEPSRPVAKPKPGPAEPPHPPEPEKANIVTLSRGTHDTPLFCIHGGDGGVIFYKNLADLMPATLPFHAVESLELGNSGPVAKSEIPQTAASYLQSIRTIQPHGPYRLAGYSFGGVVAFEIACQLREQGETVEFVGLFDTHNPAVQGRPYTP